MKPTLIAAATAAALLALPFAASAQEAEVPEETVTQIMDKLAGMNCQMAASDIEPEDDGGFDLDDVMCEDGQYDIVLDADLNEVSRRKE